MIGKIENITSVSNPKIKFIKGLLLRKNRIDSGLFLAEGMRLCKQAISSGWIPKYVIFNSEDEAVKDTKLIIDECIENNGYVLKVSLKILSKISRKENPQTILCVFERKFEEVKNVDEGSSLAWVVLDRIRDSGNLGTIIRTCDATGVNGLILIDDCCDPFSPETVRASMGAIFAIKIILMRHEEFLDWIVNKDNKVVGTTLSASTIYTDINWGETPILLMGNEQSGITEELEGKTDINIKMPMKGSSDSLNLSVSTGVFLYEILRKKEN